MLGRSQSTKSFAMRSIWLDHRMQVVRYVCSSIDNPLVLWLSDDLQPAVDPTPSVPFPDLVVEES